MGAKNTDTSKPRSLIHTQPEMFSVRRGAHICLCLCNYVECYVRSMFFFSLFCVSKNEINRRRMGKKMSQRSHRFTFLGLWILNVNYEIHTADSVCHWHCLISSYSLWPRTTWAESHWNEVKKPVIFFFVMCAETLVNLVQDAFKLRFLEMLIFFSWTFSACAINAEWSFYFIFFFVHSTNPKSMWQYKSHFIWSLMMLFI